MKVNLSSGEIFLAKLSLLLQVYYLAKVVCVRIETDCLEVWDDAVFQGLSRMVGIAAKMYDDIFASFLDKIVR